MGNSAIYRRLPFRAFRHLSMRFRHVSPPVFSCGGGEKSTDPPPVAGEGQKIRSDNRRHLWQPSERISGLSFFYPPLRTEALMPSRLQVGLGLRSLEQKAGPRTRRRWSPLSLPRG